ncbi:hypothetical protein, variant [Verruconis gallopava]|uniref:Uncharacterized protein n=1 Tax=Verruconis gallopava TaxID=253628 RepID=A0A0D1YI37_9PEZI|nr:hypothetical protein, variant [Verruconis gallopava]KIW00497.1 hypothetical protein, variant [Verruconis gallopava]
MDPFARKRSNSPVRTRHSKRMILLDEENDDWRRTSSPSNASSSTSKASSESDAAGNDLTYVTEKFSGFLADFLAEYASPHSPRSPASVSEHNVTAAAQLPSDTRSHRATRRTHLRWPTVNPSGRTTIPTRRVHQVAILS